MKLKLTFDWNCVIAVEENRPDAQHAQDLVFDHRNGKCEVALLAVSASENIRSLQFPGYFAIFEERIAALGWQDLPLVPSPMTIGLTYIGESTFIPNESFDQDMERIWNVICPNIPRDINAFSNSSDPITDEKAHSRELQKWRNAWCDVASAYSHIHAGRDIFVTCNSRDFQRNADKLKVLGMEHICLPSEARGLIARLS